LPVRRHRDATLIGLALLDAKAPVSLGIKTLTARVGAALSPDSRYLLYVDGESGRNEIHLARFPSMDRKWQVSVNGGAAPKWNRRGDRIYFIRDRTLCEVDFESGDTPRIGAPRDLFSGDAVDALLAEFGFDIMPDGKSFLVTRETEEKDVKTGVVVGAELVPGISGTGTEIELTASPSNPGNL